MTTDLAPEESLDAELEAERDFHNRFYQQATPFDLGRLAFTVEEGWNRLIPQYLKGGHIRGQRNRRFFELMDFPTIKGKRVAEIGCGDGTAGVFAAMHGADVVGMDISEVGVELANSVAEANGVADHCQFFVGNASATELPSRSVDIIILKAVLHHFVKYPGIEEELWRILKPGGKIVFADIVRDNGFYNFFKKLYLLTGVETDHGENIPMKNYKMFANRYTNFEYERRVMLEAVKRIIPSNLRDFLPFRGLVFIASTLDSLLLNIFPKLQKYTLEIVGSMQKPFAASEA